MPTSSTPPLLPRDISWLAFNHRVLQEAQDESLPLFERIKFLAIYSSNLDEFFRVRMANHRNLLRVGKKTKKELDISPKQTVRTIQRIVNRHQEEFSHIFENKIIPQLARNGIFLKRRLDMTPEDREFVENYFRENMLPYVQPVLLVKDMVRPFLNNAQLYLSIWMFEKASGKPAYAIVKIPSDHLPRFIELPSPDGQHNLIMLDDIVRHSVSWMFPGYRIEDTYSIKLTRDAELYIDDEFSGDLLQKIKVSLNRRHVGPASRFVYDRTMAQDLRRYLMDSFELNSLDILAEGRYHNNFDFFSFPDFGLTKLKYPPQPPLPYPPLEAAEDFWGAIRERDHLLHVPYQSYDSVVRFFETAAEDPAVTHIKIVQYRVARRSRIMQALMRAVQAGKRVSVFIEVKARFDEEANLRWGEKLEEAGVRVNYSFPGVKVHSKLALVRRVEDGQERIYNYLATGNFHEDTAKVYSDFGLFTADERLTGEVARIFSFLENIQEPEQDFEHLLVGQFNLRTGLEDLIRFEIKEAQAGRPSGMLLKMNSLQDPEMVMLLIEASQAGVKIDLIIRGICCLVPGRKGFTENIRGISIVDRYLEHARVFHFHHGGEERLYLSSADFMTRNLSYRIETTFPIYDPAIKRKIIEYLRIQLSDNTKARLLNDQQKNTYFRGGSQLSIRSQEETYHLIKRELIRAEEELAEREKGEEA
ncbi:polyphosphate kinase 1 [Neolewinella lacunae]|uniref:Polyphosphate kinase n=1 Tax=Neolewinella lacunae TaxID=1517758 RepID=A0A923PJA8_9BACT|nr:polyphosphate kinase 1 [Neolewinella lacunae]MBC6995183.1 polyphosphate kinase 1 [Neolewinella lacunae]MDN3634133.1 polyphosphate kinase 1 [Neolewinella lacunae]